MPQREVLVQIMADKKLITKYVFSNVEVLMLVIHSYDIFTFNMNKTAFISLYTVLEVNVVEVRGGICIESDVIFRLHEGAH